MLLVGVVQRVLVVVVSLCISITGGIAGNGGDGVGA